MASPQNNSTLSNNQSFTIQNSSTLQTQRGSHIGNMVRNKNASGVGAGQGHQQNQLPENLEKNQSYASKFKQHKQNNSMLNAQPYGIHKNQIYN
mmetsp:Transcript_5394/g.8350  ORF Transcript_5394/g.8350 Transcript_5394/m.8350 type:complete len:94 (+) Transcript_5394:3618-3899(+)